MPQEVYIDLYFLVNVSMDLIGLMITAALLRRKVKPWRAILAALIGGGYAVPALLLGAVGAVGFLLDVLVMLAMSAVAFASRKTSFLRLLGIAAALLTVSMLLGGAMTALYAWLNRLNLPLEALQGDGLSVWIFALLCSVASFATLRGGRWFGLSGKTKSVTVEVTLFGKSTALRAMVDTGNLLRDPISGKSVIVAQASQILPLLPPLLREAYARADVASALTNYTYAKQIRPIPSQTASGEGILFAIVPEKLTVTQNGEAYPADYLVAPADLGESAKEFDAVIAMG